MDYVATLQWLYAQLPMYQRVGAAALNPNLDRITALAAHLGNPHLSFNSIHVAGTNGKGSSSHMLASVLQEAGYTVGLYTSPHLKDFRERIRINGAPIPADSVVEFVMKYNAFLTANSFSFFEMTVALAFSYFADKQVDVAVIEVGLGGRLDATNIISPVGCLITNISLDHQQFLGNTRAEIAREKAGIIKPKTPVVVAEHDPETYPVFKEISQQRNAPFHMASEHQYATDLLGNYQTKNSNGVVSLLKKLPQFSISDEAIVRGLQQVVSNTGLRGRWEVLGQQPKIVADVAHNPAGLKAVFAQLNQEQFDNLHVVFGVVSDKNIHEILMLLPRKATYYVCAANVPRAMHTAALAMEFKKKCMDYSTHSSVADALNAAKIVATKKDFILVGGSVFVVAEILP